MFYIKGAAPNNKYEIGHYDPQGNWHPIRWFVHFEDAIKVVSKLNGGSSTEKTSGSGMWVTPADVG